MGYWNLGFKNKKHFKYIAVTLITTLGITFFTGASYYDGNIVDEVRNTFKTFYVDDLSSDVLNKPTVDEIIKEVNKNDPYTKYYSTNRYNDFVNKINNETSGIGVYIEMAPEGAKVLSVLDNTPESQAGIKAGDIVLMANGHLLVGLNEDAAIRYIKGEAGKSIELKIKRDTDLISLTINRTVVSFDSITGQMLDNHIGYIKINTFSEDGETLFSKIIKEDEKKKVDSYIIDLRYNGGGYANTAFNIAGYFIGNRPVAKAKSRFIKGEKTYSGKFNGILINKPLILLVNNYSASASEIITAALKDYKKAYIIGTKTYGKGSMQYAVRMSNNDYLKLTIERFFSPLGNSIDKVGVSPDFNISDDNTAFNVAELIQDSNKYMPSTKGYVRVDINNKTIMFQLSKVQNQQYWQTYRYLLGLAAKKGNVLFGNGDGWDKVPKKYLDNVAKMYYPNYEDKRNGNASVDQAFKVSFSTNMNKASINQKNIELIDIQTGNRLPVDFDDFNGKSVTVSPIANLNINKIYYIVVHPTILKADNKPRGYGSIFEYHTNNNG